MTAYPLIFPSGTSPFVGATPSIQMFPPPLPPTATISVPRLKQRSHSMAVDPFASTSEAAAAEAASRNNVAANSNLRKRRKKDLLDVAIPSDENGIQIQIIQASKIG